MQVLTVGKETVELRPVHTTPIGACTLTGVE